MTAKFFGFILFAVCGLMLAGEFGVFGPVDPQPMLWTLAEMVGACAGLALLLPSKHERA